MSDSPGNGSTLEVTCIASPASQLWSPTQKGLIQELEALQGMLRKYQMFAIEWRRERYRIIYVYISSCSVETFKSKLDKYLLTILDEPQITGMTMFRKAETNCIVDMRNV